MSILEVSNLTHSYIEKPLYDNVNFELYKGEHVGVVGQNGVGKSTLLKILMGEVIADKGDIRWNKDTEIGCLDQYAELDVNCTILDYLKTAYADLYRMESKMLNLYQESAEKNDEELMNKAFNYQEMLAAADFYSIDSEINKVVCGLGINAMGVDRVISELSGGQRAKIILAKLLLLKPDVLLMDEPTNFFDKEHIAWLSEYLSAFAGAFIVVSHDYDFLERISTRILNIEFGTIKKYHGKYSEFLKQKEQLDEDYIRRYNSQQKVIEKTEEFIRRNIAGVNTKNAQGRRKQLARLERIAAPESLNKPIVSFNQLPLEAHYTLKVADLSVGYDFPLLPKLNFTVTNGEKLVVTGFNGLGKSTLLKTLMGIIPAMSGSFKFNDSVRIGYYEQNLIWRNSSMTPIQIMSGWYPKLTPGEIRKYLAKCGVKNEHVLQEISTLSGGEQSKVKLCGLTLTPCNFLILDEPTNHFDAETKASVKEALRTFQGSVILVSHEANFYDGLADEIFDIESCLTK